MELRKPLSTTRVQKSGTVCSTPTPASTNYHTRDKEEAV
jgi:hypothetical protein